MQPAKIFFSLLLMLPIVASAQESAESKSDKAERLINQVRQKLGGEESLNSVQSLSISGKFQNFGRANESQGEIKIDLLLPDKFLKVENGFPQRMVSVTTIHAMNGNQAWADRKVIRASTDDGAIRPSIDRAQTGTPVQTGTTGMRGTTTDGITTTRTPGTTTNTVVNERTILGMRIPTPEGPDRNNELEQMENSRRASAERPKPNQTAPPNPSVKSSLLEKQVRSEFAALMFGWLMRPPPSLPMKFNHVETVKTDQVQAEAIDLTSGEDFAAILLINANELLPTMISYRDFVKIGEAYLVSANDDATGELKEIAVQFIFSDYRPVKGKQEILLPHHIRKAVNGAIISEWKIDKYKINPDLKPKKFEKK